MTFIFLGYNSVQTTTFYRILGMKSAIISTEHRISEKNNL